MAECMAQHRPWERGRGARGWMRCSRWHEGAALSAACARVYGARTAYCLLRFSGLSASLLPCCRTSRRSRHPTSRTASQRSSSRTHGRLVRSSGQPWRRSSKGRRNSSRARLSSSGCGGHHTYQTRWTSLCGGMEPIERPYQAARQTYAIVTALRHTKYALLRSNQFTCIHTA